MKLESKLIFDILDIIDVFQYFIISISTVKRIFGLQLIVENLKKCGFSKVAQQTTQHDLFWL